jgi:hypothetical protein
MGQGDRGIAMGLDLYVAFLVLIILMAACVWLTQWSVKPAED